MMPSGFLITLLVRQSGVLSWDSKIKELAETIRMLNTSMAVTLQLTLIFHLEAAPR